MCRWRIGGSESIVYLDTLSRRSLLFATPSSTRAPFLTPVAIKPSHFPWFDYSRYSCSLGVRAGDRVYLSGHTASEYDAGAKRVVVKGGMTEQVRTAYTKIGAILDAAGLSFADVVRVVEYVKPEGIERYAEA